MKLVYFMGRTGDGKSASGNVLVAHLGYGGALPFSESAGGASHTDNCTELLVAEVKVIDTPGLMDTRGVTKDEAHIRHIVDKARLERMLHAVVLVVNEQAPRFDSGMQDAVKLLVDSFGPSVLAHMGILFTRAYGQKSRQQAAVQAETIKRLISEKTGTPVVHLPFWQIDANPEQRLVMGVPEEKIAECKAALSTSLSELDRWVRTQTSLDTSGAIYDEVLKQRREADQRAAVQAAADRAAEELAAQARQRAEAQVAADRAVIEQRRGWLHFSSKNLKDIEDFINRCAPSDVHGITGGVSYPDLHVVVRQDCSSMRYRCLAGTCYPYLSTFDYFVDHSMIGLHVNDMFWVEPIQ